MSKNRFTIIPSRMSILAMKTRLVGAKKGHKLLKQKADALNLRFRKILKDIRTKKKEVIELLQEANFSLIEAKMNAGGDISMSVIQSVKNSQGILATKVRINFDNVAGVRLPVFDEVVDERRKEIVNTVKGGFHIEECRKKFSESFSKLVEIASLQTSFLTLQEAIKVTNRRVNALDKVVIPKVENTIAYIDSELDELEREEKFKLKKIGKKKEIAKKEALRSKMKLEKERKRKMLDDFEESDVVVDDEEGTTANMLEDDDDDIVV